MTNQVRKDVSHPKTNLEGSARGNDPRTANVES